MPASKKSTGRPALLASAALLSLALGLVLPVSGGQAEAQPLRPGPKTPGSRLSDSSSTGTSTSRPTSRPSSTPTKAAGGDASKAPSGAAGKDPLPTSASRVGGARLAAAGVQVQPGVGAPELPDDLSAKSWIVADAETGEVLASYNAHVPMAPASTLKMLFADTLLDRWPASQTHKVTGEELSKVGAGSSLVGVKENETYTVRDLWLGVFLRSGNDAVHVLSAMNGGLDRTVADMNARAKELQALDTHVVSPDGYDAKGQVSSAYDLTLIARAGLQKGGFREYAATVKAQFPGETKKGEDGKTSRGSFEIQNTNRLLTGAGMDQYRGIAGVKNGNTTHAGATFTGVAERGERVLLVTVMNPQKKELNRVYEETASLLDWGFAASGKVTPVGELVPPASQVAAASPSAAVAAPAGADAKTDTAAVASSREGGAGPVWIPLAIVGGVLVLLAGGGYLVHRRWPLPGTTPRRGTPADAEAAATAAESGDEAGDKAGTSAAADADSKAEVPAAAADATKAASAAADPEAEGAAEPGEDADAPDTAKAPAAAKGTAAAKAPDTAEGTVAGGGGAEARMPQQASSPRTADKGEGQPA
ncbi:serine hydrolase [Streptomyces sp. NPDC047130]|uniref:D-alanyl-D-alanine carboxypeptidase family protein n=1 Tax=Streptomyces sp. NPDC047130 TaxID=3155261 RepID=UPI0033D9C916